MVQNPRPDRPSACLVEMSEWDQVRPENDARLRGVSFARNTSAQQMVQALRNRVDIREGYEGLEIASTSFVGRVDVGSLRIAIGPKLPAMPLGILLRYAYGLRDVAALRETESPTKRHGFHELLIAMLVAEVEELAHRGLVRRYIPTVERLGSPRGRILVQELARDGGPVEARLPCRHFDRHINWRLNHVMRAGLEIAAEMTENRDLRRHALRITDSFAGVDHKDRLSEDDLARVERELTRQSASYAPALTIIRLLREMLGIAFGPAEAQSRMPGFLFDMNTFFQRLLSRFLHDNLPDLVLDEWPIRDIFAFAADANPRRRRPPAPRPDFALFRKKKLVGFLDAKYRDIWDRGLPPEWLYQLSVYALASPTQVSVILYATTSTSARQERIEIRQPVQWSTEGPASVILRPVLLPRLAELLHPDTARKFNHERRRFAEELVNPF